jgi:hypothetical protein
MILLYSVYYCYYLIMFVYAFVKPIVDNFFEIRFFKIINWLEVYVENSYGSLDFIWLNLRSCLDDSGNFGEEAGTPGLRSIEFLLRYVSKYIFILLIANAFDIETNPGPRAPKWPCGACKKAVKWNPKRPSICGDNSETWFHIDCQHVHSGVSRYMDASNMSWEYLRCI